MSKWRKRIKDKTRKWHDQNISLKPTQVTNWMHLRFNSKKRDLHQTSWTQFCNLEDESSNSRKQSTSRQVKHATQITKAVRLRYITCRHTSRTYSLQLLFLETEACMDQWKTSHTRKDRTININTASLGFNGYSLSCWIICLAHLFVCVSMSSNLSTLLSSSNTTTSVPTITETTPELLENERIFFQTAAARGISGVFVWLSLIITGHQVIHLLIFRL